MSARRPLRELGAVLATAVLAGGCAAASAGDSGSPPRSVALASTGATPAGRPTARGLPVSRVAAEPLPVSSASAHVIQPQPPAGRCHYRGHGTFAEPDPTCTPGALNPQVTAATIAVTICRSGWTETVRPPEAITEAEKRAAMRAYGNGGRLGSVEYDHLVALELGGAVNDARNLWPEPGASPNVKDGLERRLNALVCEHRLGLAAAQRAIAGDWVRAYRHFGG